MMRTQIIEGFEVRRETHAIGGGFHNTWLYRPVGTRNWVQYQEVGKLRTLKADLVRFLANRAQAVAHHEAKVRSAADVEAATRALERAIAFDAQVSAPGWDPGGLTNNPGKVQRALRDAAASKDAIKAAETALERAKALRADIEAHGV